ncbi:MAG: diphosphomevalonate/mevalonate 3,5-bisphosphate decarboxylase family protein [Bacteroidales bacterium]
MHIKGKISYSSPSNIALVKYWGKEPGDQIPMNPSLSMTLRECKSFTTVEYEVKTDAEPSIEVVFEGKRSIDIEAKLQRWFTKISYFFSWLNYATLKVESHNNFPHSAGIASSASGMSTMAMCLYGIDKHIKKHNENDINLLSNISRLGSGSASRSVLGPYALWGRFDGFENSTNDYAVRYPYVHETFLDLHDTIIVVDKEPKKISSRDGHSLMEGNPYRQARIFQANKNLETLLYALKEGNWEKFQHVTESEALSLHALMMSSEGGMLLLKGGTVDWIHYIRNKREETGLPMAFTMDAGANIHLLYPAGVHEQVMGILEESPVPSIDFIQDSTGKGPEKMIDEYEEI